MANPGSPQAMRAQQAAAPTAPMSNKTMIGMLFTLMIMMVVMSFRDAIGGALDVVFKYIAFDGDYPVLTLIIAGIIMITVSTVIRTLLTDPIAMAKNQHISSEFNKEFRQARIENNLFKMKKLQEQQPQIMAMTMEASTQQMKVMPITMLFIIPVYAWVYYFLIPGGTYFSGDVIANMPWGVLNLNDALMGFFPAWIVVYTMVSLPIGQIENRFMRFFMLKKRLAKLDAVADAAEVEE